MEWLSLAKRPTLSKAFFQINKYTTTRFLIIIGVANRFSDRDKSMGSRTHFPGYRIKYSKFLEITVEAIIHSFFK